MTFKSKDSRNGGLIGGLIREEGYHKNGVQENRGTRKFLKSTEETEVKLLRGGQNKRD